MANKKSERLLELLQLLRERRYPVAGKDLAEQLGVTLRTLYRDIEALRGLGASIEGEAGVGYLLSSDFFMPPMMLTREELDALVLGLRSVIYGPDKEMGEMAQSVRSKIFESLPKNLQAEMDMVGLFAFPSRTEISWSEHISTMRNAIRDELEVQLTYRDGKGQGTQRAVWPIALGYAGERQMLTAWCTLRADFRSFWLDRVEGAELSAKRYARPRRTLMHEWRKKSSLPPLQ